MSKSVLWYQSLNKNIQKYLIDIIYNLSTIINSNNNINSNLDYLKEFKKISDTRYKINLNHKNGILILEESSTDKIKILIINEKYDFCITLGKLFNFELLNEFNKNIIIVYISNICELKEKLDIILNFIKLFNHNVPLSYNLIEDINSIKQSCVNNINNINIILDNLDRDINTNSNIYTHSNTNTNVNKNNNINDTDSNSVFSSITNDDVDKLISDTKKMLNKKVKT